jgi:hypothetical protein
VGFGNWHIYLRCHENLLFLFVIVTLRTFRTHLFLSNILLLTTIFLRLSLLFIFTLNQLLIYFYFYNPSPFNTKPPQKCVVPSSSPSPYFWPPRQRPSIPAPAPAQTFPPTAQSLRHTVALALLLSPKTLDHPHTAALAPLLGPKTLDHPHTAVPRPTQAHLMDLLDHHHHMGAQGHRMDHLDPARRDPNHIPYQKKANPLLS